MARINGFNYQVFRGADGEPVAKRVLTEHARPNPSAHVRTPHVDRDGRATGKRVEWIFLVPITILVITFACVLLSQVSVLPV